MATASTPDAKGGTRGAYRAGEATRGRLLEAALVLFSQQGYGATSTREIATRAAVALPAIAYHFGDKQGLHFACARDVLERYGAVMAGAFPDGLDGLATLAPDEARASLKQVMRRLVDMLATGSRNESWMDLMLREMGTPGPVHDYLYNNLWRPGLDLVTTLITRCRPGGLPDINDPVKALLLLAGLSAFSNFRLVSLKYLGFARVDEGARDALLTEIEGLIDRF